MFSIIKLMFLLFSASCLLYAQDAEQNVIATAGDYHANSFGSISWTLGEVSTETYTSGFTLSQGFQQAALSVISLTDPQELTYSLSVYPNPTSHILHIESDESGIDYALYNSQAQLILNGETKSNTEILNLTALPNGTYVLRVNNQETHKIVVVK